MTGNERPCPDDLLARGQRHELSNLEKRALDAHLEVCGPCRAASAMATLFDTIPETQPEDGQLISRVTKGAIRAHRIAGWRGLRAAAVVALVVLTGGGAVAAWIAHRASNPPTAASLAPVGRALRAAGRPPARSTAMPEALEIVMPPAPRAEQPKAAPAPERKRQPTVRVEAAPSPDNTDTAASLFTQANAVRRAGEVGRAIALYQALRQRFPDSEEAHLSSISQGDLLLGEGEPGRAIAAYSAYLRAAPRGSLTEEALFGKARSLGLLDRQREERETWQELTRRFPHSAYRPAAQRRVRELAP
jgi:TolA-binding protein